MCYRYYCKGDSSSYKEDTDITVPFGACVTEHIVRSTISALHLTSLTAISAGATEPRRAGAEANWAMVCGLRQTGPLGRARAKG